MNFAREQSTCFHVEQRATTVRWHTKIQSCTEAGEPGLLAIKHGAAGVQRRVIQASLREHEETFLRIKKLDAGLRRKSKCALPRTSAARRTKRRMMTGALCCFYAPHPLFTPPFRRVSLLRVYI